MPSLYYEKQHGRDLGMTICGVDEAGRGPLAGPVMAAAVILPAKIPRAIARAVRDSKQMTAQEREDIFEPLTQLCIHAIAEATVEEIARFNILWASMLAMKRAVEGLEENLRKRERYVPLPLAGGVRGGPNTGRSRRMFSDGNIPLKNKLLDKIQTSGPPPAPPASGRGAPSPLPPNNFPKTKIDIALIDGNRAPQLGCKTVPIVRGDDKCLSIAAASILAKVTRDRLMRKLAGEHPGYGWERNVGYGTPEHLAALRQLGPTAWHRAGFAPVAQLEFDVA